MRIPSGKTDQYIYFVAVDSTDLKTRETGLSSFTVYRSRNGGAATAYTTPTINETDSTNMPGVYELLIDEDTTIAAGSDSEEYVVHITQASMAPVTRTIELYRRDTTSGQTLTVTSGGVTLADGVSHGGTLGSSTATLALSRANFVSQTATQSALVLTGNTSGHGLLATGGTTGTGATFTGGATSGAGLVATAPTNGDGATFSGTGTSRHGINTSAGSSGSGINAAGAGSGSGIVGTGGATGTGIRGTGGASSGAGLTIAAVNGNAATFLAGTTGAGISATGAGTGDGIIATSGSGATGNGITALAASTNGNGIKSTGTGTGDGMELTAGASGVDLDANLVGTITGNMTGDITGNLSGSVGSVTGNVGGNVVGSVASVTANVTVGAMAAAALADFFDTNSGTTYASAVAGSVVKEIADNAGGSALTAAAIADAVWDEAQADHVTAGSFGIIASEIADILVDTAEIGAAGAGLTNINLPNQTMDIVGNITGNLSGSVGSVTGAVGSVTGAVGSVTGLTNATIADAVWDEDATAHQTTGTFGQAIGDPGADTNSIFKAVVTDATGATVGVDVVALKAETSSIQTDTNDIQTRLPAALVSGRMDSSVGAMAANVMTAAATNADYVTELQSGLSTLNAAAVSAAVWDAATASYGGAGSYGLLVETNLDAAVSSRLSTAGYTAPDNASIAAILVDTSTTLQGELDGIQATVDAILVDTTEIGVAGAGLTNINLPDQTMNITGNITGNLSGSVGSVTGAVGSVTGNVGGNVTGSVGSVTGLTNATIADQVWEEAIADHSGTVGSTAEALAAAGSAGDPWATALPGAYGAGTAGKIIGDNINAPIGTVDTVVDAIKAKTDSLTFSVAGQVDSNVSYVNGVQVTGTGAPSDEWGPA